jgi:hypothetical protein
MKNVHSDYCLTVGNTQFLRLKILVAAVSSKDKFLNYFFGLNYWSLTE